ncbi:hypothetical protein [Novosphingobium sp.]|uniref:hypothetical protein n=1 Tax=Novosphingobium sp. TaxID=1874826 RepID=UPI003BAC849A
MSQHSATPGRDWLDIVTSADLAAFASAFSHDPQLSASVLPEAIFGVAHIRAFFEATRAMYGRIAFIRETRARNQCFLEWEGSFRGMPVEGVTVLDHDAASLISRVRLFHLPSMQVAAFAGELAQRLTSPPETTGLSPCA